jgi:hypothetical protein
MAGMSGVSPYQSDKSLSYSLHYNELLLLLLPVMSHLQLVAYDYLATIFWIALRCARRRGCKAITLRDTGHIALIHSCFVHALFYGHFSAKRFLVPSAALEFRILRTLLQIICTPSKHRSDLHSRVLLDQHTESSRFHEISIDEGVGKR